MILFGCEERVFSPLVFIKSALIVFFATSCTHFSSRDKDSEPSQPVDGEVKEVPPVQKESRKKSRFFDIFSDSAGLQNDKLKEEQDLKMAKLWSRLDDLSSEQSRLRERLRVIEKGLTLGLIPEELKETRGAHQGEVGSRSPSKYKDKTDQEGQPLPEVVEENPEKIEKAPDVVQPEKEHQVTENEYQNALAAAHEQFRSGAYGRAIIDYESIGKKFGEKLQYSELVKKLAFVKAITS